MDDKPIPPMIVALLNWTPPPPILLAFVVSPHSPHGVARIILGGSVRAVTLGIPDEVPDLAAFMEVLDTGARMMADLDASPEWADSSCEDPRCEGCRDADDAAARLAATMGPAAEAFEDAVSRVAVPEDDCGPDPIGGRR